MFWRTIEPYTNATHVFIKIYIIQFDIDLYTQGDNI